MNYLHHLKVFVMNVGKTYKACINLFICINSYSFDKAILYNKTAITFIFHLYSLVTFDLCVVAQQLAMNVTETYSNKSVTSLIA